MYLSDRTAKKRPREAGPHAKYSKVFYLYSTGQAFSYPGRDSRVETQLRCSKNHSPTALSRTARGLRQTARALLLRARKGAPTWRAVCRLREARASRTLRSPNARSAPSLVSRAPRGQPSVATAIATAVCFCAASRPRPAAWRLPRWRHARAPHRQLQALRTAPDAPPAH